MDKNFSATLKSSETEDWLDLHVIRPFCYYCALAFNKFDVHPNTVTIWSMIIGAASAFFFACGSFYYSGTWGVVMNIVAIILLMIADIFDCTDGQLARMTGKKSRMGRILDGVAGFAWFIPIYHALVYRFYLHHDIVFAWLGIDNTQQNTIIATVIVYVLGVISGVAGLAGQQRLADYYIQVHLFFLKGKDGSELDDSEKQKEKLKELEDMGVESVIVTDISKDGAMNGTNLDLYGRICRETGMKVTASGGISTIGDISALREMGLWGAIIGKAYYTGAIRLEDALEAAG